MTVEQYKEILEVSKEELSALKNNIELVCIYRDLDKTTVGLMKTVELSKIMLDLQEEMRGYSVGSEVEMEGVTLQKKNFTELTLGEFIDLESYLQSGEIEKLLAVLYRKKYYGGMIKTQYEAYNQVDINYRSERFLQKPANQLVKIWQEYINYRNELIGVYQSLFEEEIEELSEEDVLTVAERTEMERRKQHGEFAWESLIMFLCNDDITKWEAVCDLPVILAFNITSYQKASKKSN